MTNADIAREAREITSATRVGLVFNMGLAAMKFIVGLIVGSLALVADGVNSLSDIITDFAVIIGARLGAKPADRDHPFGHGKIETLVAGIVDAGVIGVGALIVWTALKALIQHSDGPTHGLPVIIASAITMGCKEWLFHRTHKVADRCRSAALKGKAWDHRSDVAVSTVVLVGGAGVMLGWEHADAVAGLVVGSVVLIVGLKLVYEIFVELTEGTAGEKTEEQINSILCAIPEVRGWHNLRTRRIGRELLMDIHILLDANLTIDEAHNIVRSIEATLSKELEWPVNPMIHIDPDNAEIRAKRMAMGDKTLK
ncbi:MAG: cation transporter [Calditrichaeota bacterium]|nr:cation transporter [Calditrichota bacterium]